MSPSSTPHPPARRFTLSDAMILVAATALGLGATTHILGNLPANLVSMRTPTERAIAMVDGVALSWCYALPLLRLRPPRPRRRRLFGQPGMVACFAVILSTLFRVGFSLVGRPSPRYVPGRSPNYSYFLYSVFSSATNPLFVAPMIAAAWSALLLSGRWRPARDGIERAGRALGLGWILWMIVVVVRLRVVSSW